MMARTLFKGSLSCYLEDVENAMCQEMESFKSNKDWLEETMSIYTIGLSFQFN
jgi:hypothetical protein